ncbi:MAG: glycosyltransferase, partial [Planctomycetaceae bacterium]|nr:glycosyltransferase [Planctomycetaceae bacterium]
MTGERPGKTLLLIAERFPPDLGGVSRSAFRTARAIAALGWQVHVLAWTKSLAPGTIETSIDEDKEDNIQPGRMAVHRLGLFSNWDFSLQHSLNVLEWLHEKFQFNLVWGHYVYPAGYLAVVFGESIGIPSTVSARGNDIDRLMFPPGDFARLMWSLDRATAVSCVSHDLSRKVKMLLGKPIECALLPNVVNADVFHPATDQANDELREALGISSQEAILGFCGELRHKKGLPFLLSALLEVQQDRPACLLVIGEVRPREQVHLATFAGEHPQAAERILVTGHLENPTDVA